MLTTCVSCTELTHGLPTGIKSVTLPANHNLVEIGCRRGDQYDLDNFYGAAGFVAIGTGYFLHFWWIYPHPVGSGRRHSLD